MGKMIINYGLISFWFSETFSEKKHLCTCHTYKLGHLYVGLKSMSEPRSPIQCIKCPTYKITYYTCPKQFNWISWHLTGISYYEMSQQSNDFWSQRPSRSSSFSWRFTLFLAAKPSVFFFRWKKQRKTNMFGDTRMFLFSKGLPSGKLT